MSLWDEIHEQPAVLERMLAHNRATVSRIAASLGSGVEYVMIAARGTSDNAARYAQYVWGIRNRLPVALAVPSLFGPYRSPPRLDHALVVGISQSGESPDLVAVLEEAGRQGRPTLAITNHPGSPMGRLADMVLSLHAGEERAIAATKTYTAELLAVAMLSAALTGDGDGIDHVAAVPAAAREVLDISGAAREAADTMTGIDRTAVLGRGYHRATVFEWALKLQELAHLVAQPYSTADFRHGPVAMVEVGFPVLAVATEGPVYGDLETVLSEVRGRGAQVVAISDRNDCPADLLLPLPAGIPEWIAPIPAIVAAQLFTYHLTVAKGLDPDRPRGLHKVTRTR